MQKTRFDLLTILFLTVVLAILFFGLRPKTWSVVNDAHWLSKPMALKFNTHGIAYVDDMQSYNGGEFTIHICAAPDAIQKQGFKPLLMVHSGDDQQQLSIWSWGNSLIVMNGDDYSYARREPRISATDVFTAGSATLISITSGKRGTRLFINGRLNTEIRDWSLTMPSNLKKRRLILGNSIYGKHGWAGEISGLALYGKALSPEEVRRHYNQWLPDQYFSPDLDKDVLLLFTFRHDAGHIIPDQSGHQQPLLLPARLSQLKRTFLSPPWHNFNPNRSFWIDAILNLIGFIPLGAVTYLWVRQRLSLNTYALTMVLLFCFLLSLGIELSQGWLPQRSSSLSDLILNTLGAGLGICLSHTLLKKAKG